MIRHHATTTALILAAVLIMTACGNSQDSGSSASKEIKGLLEVPADQANEQAGKQLGVDARMNMGTARGEMSAHMRIIERSGSDTMQSKAAALNDQFESEYQTAGELWPKMSEADSDILSDLVERYNENWQDLQQTLGQAEDLQTQALEAG